MKPLLTTKLFFVLLLSVLSLQQLFAAEEDVFVGTLSELKVSDGYFYSDDRLLYFNNFTVVQRYIDNDPEQRLPMSAVQEGDWIRVYFTYSRSADKFSANRVEILPNSNIAYKLIKEAVNN